MKPAICIYHDNCPDGITAMWVVKKAIPDVEPYAGRYDETPDLERLRGRDVYLVDFSYKRAALEQIIDVAKSVTILDHHKTAQADLDGINCACVFDMTRSGALIAWSEFFPGSPPPPLVLHVSDRDLWQFKLPGTREIHAACGLLPLTLEARDELMKTDPAHLIERGRVVLQYHDELVRQATKYRPRRFIGGHNVPFVICPIPALISDVGHALCIGEPFACVATERDDGSFLVSLRSSDDGIDVSQIAVSYGGGGHKHAAGFVAKSEVDLSSKKS
jgi:uncharacterized protein